MLFAVLAVARDELDFSLFVVRAPPRRADFEAEPLRACRPFLRCRRDVRAPLLGASVPEISWAFALVLGLVGTALTILLYRRAYARIPYWV